jgi:hypothetical protein
MYEGVSGSFRTDHLERELQMVQLSATWCSCIAILWVSIVSFAAITLCVASQGVFIVVSVCFVIDSVRKLLDIPSYALGQSKDGNRALEYRSGHVYIPYILVLYAVALWRQCTCQRAKPLSTEQYKFCERFVVPQVILNLEQVRGLNPWELLKNKNKKYLNEWLCNLFSGYLSVSVDTQSQIMYNYVYMIAQ